MTRNEFKTTVKLSRRDICDLLIACLMAQDSAMDGGDKWCRLHDELRAQLDELDAQLDALDVFSEKIY